MTRSATVTRPRSSRLALVGLAGAVLSGIGDVLILGRSCSGRDFDQAAGRVPAEIDADPRWRSLWNGAELPVGRIHAGTLVGYVGIGLLQWLALRGMSRTIPAGRGRRLAGASATAFAVSGVMVHQGCATVILAYRREGEALTHGKAPAPSPRWATRLLAASAAGTLGALGVFSASLAVAGRRDPAALPAWRSAVTPLPLVLAALATFGRLPAPIGGYLRPASISTGLLAYFALSAVMDRRRDEG